MLSGRERRRKPADLLAAEKRLKAQTQRQRKQRQKAKGVDLATTTADGTDKIDHPSQTQTITTSMQIQQLTVRHNCFPHRRAPFPIASVLIA